MLRFISTIGLTHTHLDKLDLQDKKAKQEKLKRGIA